jgi:hypothetical protein
MTVASIKLAGKRFVIVPEKEFRDLQRRADKAPGASNKRRARSAAQDRADIKLALKRLADPNEKRIPYEQIRKELRLG